MPNITPRLGLKLPLGNEIVNRANYSENLNALEQNTAAITDVIDLGLAAGRGGSFVGYGWEPLGGIVRIDDDDPRIQYSVGDWSRNYASESNREGLNSYKTVSSNIGATCTISFIGTGLVLYSTLASTNGKFGVSIDGGAETLIDLYSTIGVYTAPFVLASGLSFGFHTVKLTIKQKNPASSSNNVPIFYFDIITTTDNTLKLARDGVQNKSSAITLGNRNDSTVDINQSVDEITQLVPNASFKRISPTWGTLFQDDFNRADGSAGNGWITGGGVSISGNKLQLQSGASKYALNGDLKWQDREIRFKYIPSTVAINAYFKYFDDSNNMRLLIATGSVNNMYLQKVVNGVFTNTIDVKSFTVTSGETYYVTLRSLGNIYTASITTNPDYVTGITTCTCYESGVPSGMIGFVTDINAGNTLIDDVVVTGPVPEGWTHNAYIGTIASLNNNVWKVVNNLSVIGNIYRIPSTATAIPVTAGQQYTVGIKRKLSQYISGNGTDLTINWYQSDGTTLISFSTPGTYITTVDSDFTLQTFTATAPSNSAYVTLTFRFNGIGTCEWKEPIFVQGTTVPAFHTKESRCDLVLLQNDGQVIVTKGTGEDELGYRVEEDGSISKFYRDKKQIPHFDRVKVWNTGITNDTSTGFKPYAIPSSSGGGALDTIYSGATFYVSFVGTGIDMMMYQAAGNGIIGVTIDGGSEFFIDTYAPLTSYQNRINIAKGLPYGQHQVKIRNTGSKNTLSTGIDMVIDAFDIYVPKIPATPADCQPLGAVIKADPDHGWIRFEENEGVVYSGTWSDYVPIMASNGKIKGAATLNDYAEFSFIGTGIRWIGEKYINIGIAEVLIDTGSGYVSQGNIDGYGTIDTFISLYSKTDLPLKLNKVKILCTHTKNASSADYYVIIDAFEVRQPLYVIDLRKFLGQVDIEAKIAEHENKDLFDAHPWAVKGQNKKERIERDRAWTTITPSSTGWQKVGDVTWSKAFTVPPSVFVQQVDTNVLNANNYMPANITTTGCQIWANVTTTGSAIPGKVVAIGY